MSSSTILLRASILLFLLLTLFNFAEPLSVQDSQMSTNMESSASSPPTLIDCGAACGYRCSKSRRPRLCRRACGTCCARCHCVPPGTSGNQDKCPCYAARTTHHGRRKCP
ncbi:snakin-2-like [Phalaenopsis equestris]|uniref:snakin-2-like n=1 Tax=Phalaenopsis equestris TaxID=78828 RepID=UPI0009E50838|nr:snakin-2-like [Phalaenopsis equestris]